MCKEILEYDKKSFSIQGNPAKDARKSLKYSAAGARGHLAGEAGQLHEHELRLHLPDLEGRLLLK